MEKQVMLRLIFNFKYFRYILLLLLLISCKQSDSQQKKDYLFNPDSLDKIKNYKIEQLNNDDYNIKKFVIEINQEEYISEKVVFNQDIKEEKKLQSLNTNYGKVKFENVSEEGDAICEYYLVNFIREINSYIINIARYENSATIVLNKREYDYFEVAGELYISPDKKHIACLKNEESRYGIIEIYLVENGKMINLINLWSNNIIPEEINWNNQNDILVKALKANEGKIGWFKISSINKQ